MPSDLPQPLLHSLRLLIRANHILHHHSLVDAFGHISLRHPFAPDQYLLAAYDPGAPALVKSRADFIAYRVSDSSPVDPDAPQGYSERFIHGEILKKFPHAKCVVHSHSETVVPFTLAKHDVRPVVHMAGFLGVDPVPVFKVHDQDTDMLIKTPQLGCALANALSADQPVVLQHHHGFTTFGSSVEQAVYRAIYTQMNCKLLAQALVFAGGDADKVEYLSSEQAKACAVMNKKCQDKSWRLWVREVQVLRLYVNEEGEPEPGTVGGMRV